MRIFKYLCLLVLFTNSNINSNAQVDSTITLDLLRVPNSPAFTILGIAPTSIEEPTNPTDLLVSVRNATDNLQSFPSSYSLDFAPGWVFGGEKITYEEFANDKIRNSIVQNSMISLATNSFKDKDSIEVTQFGIGFKISLKRGKIDEQLNNLKEQKDTIYGVLNNLLKDRAKYIEAIRSDSDILQQEDEILKSLIENKEEGNTSITDEEIANQYKKIKAIEDNLFQNVMDSLQNKNEKELKQLNDIASRIKFERTGLKLDLAGGINWDFKNSKFESGEVAKYGVWLTGGNVWKAKKSSVSLLGTTRLLFSPNETFELESQTLVEDNLRLDFGARLIYRTLDSNFSISAESLYRTVLNNENIEDTHKISFNLDYHVGNNKNLTLSIGRNFDGNFEQDGNLIALLNFVSGFGSKRPFK